MNAAEQSLSLRDAIREALTNPAARIAEAQLEDSQGQVHQAGLHPNPRLYLQSEDIRPWARDFSFASQTEDYGYLGQIIELDGKRSKRLAVAQANRHRSQAVLQLAMQQIEGAVASSYWATVLNESIVELLDRDLTAMDATVRYHKERVAAGAMKGLDLIRLQIERDRIALALTAAKRDAELARTELFRQIGRPATRTVRLTDKLGEFPVPPTLAIQAAFEQRADLAAARDQLELAEAELKLQRAQAVPDPDLLGGYKRNSGNDTIFASIQIPLPVRNRNQGEIERAQVQVRSARAAVEKTELAIRADIEAATGTVESEQESVERTVPDLRAHAQQNLDIVTEAYRLGGVDLLRYIDAERTRIDVEVLALRTLADYNQSVLRLQLAYGGRP